MTGCKGYGLRGSDARTEIERTKEADTPGEIPGRSGLQADRRTGNKFIMRGVWLRSKEMEEIIMTLSMKEKKILYAYGCPSRPIGSRVKRLAQGELMPASTRTGYYLTQNSQDLRLRRPFPGPRTSSQEGGNLFETDTTQWALRQAWHL